MKHLKRNIKAISPVLAVLMMIAVAIAGALVTYAWVMGYIGFQTQKSGQSIQIQSIANSYDDEDLLVYVQNVGESVLQMEENSCLYVNGVLVACDISNVSVTQGTATLGLGETATLRYIGGAALPGEKVEVKVTTVLGTSNEMSEYPAGSTRVPPELDYFRFDIISSPQTSEVPFEITITAIDQYGIDFTDYTGYINTLTYSGGTIDPSETSGGFVNGVWSGMVTVTGSGSQVYLSTAAVSDPEITGTSNTFEVDAAVSYVTSGTGGKYLPGSSPAVDTLPTYPAGLEAGDLILLQVGVRDTTTNVTTPTGFTLLFGPDTTGQGRQWIFYRFSNGNETGNLDVTWTGTPTNVVMQMYSFTHVATTSFTESEVLVSEDTITIAAPSVTTNGDRRLVVAFIYAADNQDIDSFDGETGGDWTLADFLPADSTSSQEDAAIAMQTAPMLDAGEISGGTYTREGVYESGQTWCVRAFALMPLD